MKRVLIIGGSGFIGKNITEKLVSHGIFVASYDLYENLYANKNYIGNINDDKDFENIVGGYDEIIYLITTVSPKQSMENPDATYVKDIPLLLKTLDACVKNGVKRVIYSSSGGTVYGDSNGKKLKETNFNEPKNHYAVCKLTCEKILEMYNSLYNMENITLRISNPFGKGQNPTSGVGFITAVINQIMSGKQVELYGDGSVVRDFVDVEDVAEAFYLAVEWKFDNKIIPVFNIGSGEGVSLKEIVYIVSDILGVQPQIRYFPKRNFDVLFNVLDINKAIKELNYLPNSNIRSIIKKYIDFINKNHTSDDDITVIEKKGER